MRTGHARPRAAADVLIRRGGGCPWSFSLEPGQSPPPENLELDHRRCQAAVLRTRPPMRRGAAGGVQTLSPGVGRDQRRRPRGLRGLAPCPASPTYAGRGRPVRSGERGWTPSAVRSRA